METSIKQYLKTFLDSLSASDPRRKASISADHFCNDELNANRCAQLILEGKKTATCSLRYWYQEGGERMPAVGDLQVVTDWYGNPCGIIETIQIDQCRYDEVSAEFAFQEGEGNRTLDWWREAHWAFFSKECKEIGIVPSSDMWLVLERFRLIYR